MFAVSPELVLIPMLAASSSLWSNAIGDQGVVALAEALRVNRTITAIR
jgi:hypothetical protein